MFVSEPLTLLVLLVIVAIRDRSNDACGASAARRRPETARDTPCVRLPSAGRRAEKK